jgi:hypothetical protein
MTKVMGMSCRPAAAPLDDEVQGIWPCCPTNLPLPPSAVVKLASVNSAGGDVGERVGAGERVGVESGCGAWRVRGVCQAGAFLRIRQLRGLICIFISPSWRTRGDSRTNLDQI